MFQNHWRNILSRNVRPAALSLVCVVASLLGPVSGLAQQTGSTARRDYCTFAPDIVKANGLRIVFLSGDEEYRSEEAFPMLAKILAKHHGFHCTVLFPVDPKTGEIDPNNQVNIPGMEMIQSADLIVMGWRFRHPPAESMKFFLDHLYAGKPIIGIRTSTHAFQFPNDAADELRRLSTDSSLWPGGFGKQVLGDTWVAHHGDHGSQSTRGVIEAVHANHPILCGVNDIWGPTDVYAIGQLPDDATILVRGQVLEGMKPTDQPVIGPKNDPMMPLIWTREFALMESDNTGRYVCTTIGSADDFVSEGLRRVLVNACYWCTRTEAKIRADSNVDFVGPYEPTKFGFNAFIKGRTPRDYDWKDDILSNDPEMNTLTNAKSDWKCVPRRSSIARTRGFGILPRRYWARQF